MKKQIEIEMEMEMTGALMRVKNHLRPWPRMIWKKARIPGRGARSVGWPASVRPAGCVLREAQKERTDCW